jgi:hypothetical protein
MQAAEAAPTQLSDDVTATAADNTEAAAAAACDGLAAASTAPEPVDSEADDSDDGFEFSSDAASDSSSSWDSSEEETDVPLAASMLPSWLARKGAATRCVLAHACSTAAPRTQLNTAARLRGSDVDDDDDDGCPRMPSSALEKQARKLMRARV